MCLAIQEAVPAELDALLLPWPAHRPQVPAILPCSCQEKTGTSTRSCTGIQTGSCIQICAHVYVHYTGGIKMVFSRRIYIFSFWFLTDDHAQYTFCCSVFNSVKVWQCRRCYYSVYECLSRSLFTLGLVLIPSAGTQVWAVGRIFFLFISLSLSSNSVLKRCRNLCHRRSTWGPISAYDWLRPLCH